MAKNTDKPRIFVSYRRSESGTAGRIFDRLIAHFGEDNVFIDIDNIPFGADFRQHIGEALRPGDLLIAIVGRNWLGPIAGGRNRIDDETDPVRIEIETALERDISLLPVLVDDATMPTVDQLPDTIKEFSYRNAAEVEPGRDFHFHVDRLIRSIDEIFAGKLSPVEAPSSPASKPKGSRPVVVSVAVGLVLLAVAAVGALTFLRSGRIEVESDRSTYAAEVSRSSQTQPSADAALAAWNVVKDMESVGALEAFIARYGDSFYADLAKAKIKALKNAEAEKKRKAAEEKEAKTAAVAPPKPEPLSKPESIELEDLLRMFMIPSGADYNVAGWDAGSAADSPIEWEHDGLKDCDDHLQEQYKTPYCRVGNVQLTVGGSPTHTVLARAVEPGRWKVTLMGPRVGPFYVSIEPDIMSPELEPGILQEAVSRSSNGLRAVSMQKCGSFGGGDELFRVSPAGMKPAYLIENWSCGASNCITSFVLTFSQQGAQKLMAASFSC